MTVKLFTRSCTGKKYDDYFSRLAADLFMSSTFSRSSSSILALSLSISFSRSRILLRQDLIKRKRMKYPIAKDISIRVAMIKMFTLTTIASNFHIGKVLLLYGEGDPSEMNMQLTSHVGYSAQDQYVRFKLPSTAFRISSIASRSCCIVSRYLIVTVPSSLVCWSTVTQ
jgi:hypothetical protein